MGKFLLFGWRLSYYTSKTLCYFRYKNIPMTEKFISFFEMDMIKKQTGAMVMPAVMTPDGEWLQDSRHIIEKMEIEYPTPSVFPSTPRRKFISGLLEAWGDEYWLSPAMYYRWNMPENVESFKREAGDNLLPWTPRFIKNLVANKTAAVLISYLPAVGIVPDQHKMMEEWTVDMVQKLNAHFEHHPYLLGDIPTIGDFGLAGPFVAHLGYDPASKKALLSDSPHLSSWIDRVSTVSHLDIATNAGPETDDIPETLLPVLHSVFTEFMPMLQASVAPVCELSNLAKFTTEGKKLPRSLGPVQFPMGKHTFSRNAAPFHLWKAQILKDEFLSMTSKDQKSVKNWLQDEKFDNSNMLFDLQFPRLERHALLLKFSSDSSDKESK